MLTEERTYLLRIAARVRDEVRKWIDSGDSQIIPDVPLYDRFEELSKSVAAATEIEPGGIEHLVSQFRVQWESHKRKLLQTQDPEQLPDRLFWERWFAIEDQVIESEKKPIPPVESVAVLDKQGVYHRQIADIYGWFLPNGAPDTSKVSEELASPGTHAPKGYQTPHQRRRSLENERLVSEANFWRTRLERKVSVLCDVAPESIRDLALTGVSAKQIARMKRMTIDDVFAECDKLNIPRPVVDYGQSMLTEGRFDKIQTEEQRRLQEVQLSRVVTRRQVENPKLSDVRLSDDQDQSEQPTDGSDEPAIDDTDVAQVNQQEQVLEYARTGMSAKEIAEHTGLTAAKVKSLLKSVKVES